MAYLAKVLSFNGAEATIQPLQRDTSTIPNVPVAQNARYKLTEQTVNRLVNGDNGCSASFSGNVTVKGTAVAEGQVMTSTGSVSGSGSVNCSCYSQSFTNLVKTPLQAGDIVICICCEQNISTAKKGAIPSSGEPKERHSLSNSIIVGIL